MNARFSARLGSGRRLGAVLATVSAVGLVATACAAGQIAETAEETPVRDAGGGGQGADIGGLSVSAVALAPPSSRYYKSGDDALLQVVIANQGSSADQLVGVSTPVADSVSLQSSSAALLSGTPIGSVGVSNPLTGSLASSASASVSPERTVPSAPGLSAATNQTSPGPSPTVTVSSSVSVSAPNSLHPSGSNSVLPTPGAALSSSPSVQDNALTIDPNSAVSIGYRADNPAIVLHLNKDMYPAQPFAVTFTFKQAGSVTVTSVVRLITSGPPPSVVPSLTATE